ncbi:hypothetical protein GQ55_1G363900 [Panicum hallii var. hallii]|uniref:Uncharacterized protein n=1 Tax=Panicum hallii var. hallii TaxID=1504633 RepID=A0A2T7FB90_9POAL|nr:hypothetical protein GQ55_1G363900 [Panicum hallii var. hallii]
MAFSSSSLLQISSPFSFWCGQEVDGGGRRADGGGATNRTEQCLPPVVFRLEAPHACFGQFAAFGTKIMFMGTIHNPWRTVPMYDVRTRALTSAPRRDSEPNPFSHAYVQVGGKLFILDNGVFEMLQPPPPPPLDGALLEIKFDWSWSALPMPSYHDDVVSYAVRPDERAMVFGAMAKHSLKKGNVIKHATFSFDIESSRWTRHGAWGRVAVQRSRPPACKLSKEKLFRVDPAEKHIGATLVYVGDDRARFCLVQCLSVDDRQGGGGGGGGIWKESMPEQRRYLLRVATFSLKYDKNIDLRATNTA